MVFVIKRAIWRKGSGDSEDHGAQILIHHKLQLSARGRKYVGSYETQIEDFFLLHYLKSRTRDLRTWRDDWSVGQFVSLTIDP